MRYYNTALKSTFTDLITFNISSNLEHDHELKQGVLENVWAAISTLDKNPAHMHEINGVLDFLNDAIVLLESMKTNRERDYFINEINQTIENIKREIQ